ncbi:hypothetical protein DCS_07207 [Drechmeria coniospora]|uniref:Life-span regulatory factor domain-containing protein n=1 Tax=Drechmeria coniospora TaxID=98403 RepID=A0A151GDU6_DRECN|nr:hypothetical protein DCS_07207 [Drechmeria coniospora]KYK55244.1 hypothetical protein DCS_07207 [Drechmeria coniospora]ODA82132.1 hypothetical protein RJ55_00638 [Drechmeria coniospora]
MALDLWSHQFCLACDKQVQSDGAAYCSEACRLADHETTSTPSSRAGSPSFAPSGYGYPWTTCPRPSSPSTRGLCLSPSWDLSMPARSFLAPSSPSAPPSNLTPSSSHSSLCSMRSAASSTDSTSLSRKSMQELKAYAVSFEQGRVRRR